MHIEIRRAAETAASRWLLMMLALILLGVMHIVLPSTGGSGADLPEPLLVWCVLLVAMVGCAWILRHQTLRSSPFLRELVIPFGASGYVALFEIVGNDRVIVGAVRHQREDDYH